MRLDAMVIIQICGYKFVNKIMIIWALNFFIEYFKQCTEPHISLKILSTQIWILPPPLPSMSVTHAYAHLPHHGEKLCTKERWINRLWSSRRYYSMALILCYCYCEPCSCLIPHTTNPCLVVLPNARRASDRFVHCVLGVKWGGGHVAAPFVPMVVALVLNFLCTQYYSLREGG